MHPIVGEAYSPTELSALVLHHLANYTKSVLGPIGAAVVTIPANFSTKARIATFDAARSAELSVDHIINEPTAAALYYAFEGLVQHRKGIKTDGTYAVYDLGGGTIDISIVNFIREKSGVTVEVKVSNGIPKLGGMDFDRALQILVQQQYKNDTGAELGPYAYDPENAEIDKRSLSKGPASIDGLLPACMPPPEISSNGQSLATLIKPES